MDAGLAQVAHGGIDYIDRANAAQTGPKAALVPNARARYLGIDAVLRPDAAMERLNAGNHLGPGPHPEVSKITLEKVLVLRFYGFSTGRTLDVDLSM